MPTDKPKARGLSPDVKKLFSATEVGALLEDVDQNLRTLAEGQQAIGQKLDRVARNQEAHGRRLDRVEVRLDTIETRQPNQR